jgi:hypothetical protein
MTKINYQPEKCDHCGQTKTYLLGIDRGSVEIVKQVARAIGQKGINCVHVNKELVGKYLTPIQMTNMSRPRSHGLIAHVRGEGMKGNYLLTRKGAAFLRGERIPKYAIMSKTENRQIGYFEPETETIAITDFNGSEDYWEGINYEIVEGNVLHKRGDGTLFSH